MRISFTRVQHIKNCLFGMSLNVQCRHMRGTSLMQRCRFPPPKAGHVGSVSTSLCAPRHVRSVTNVLAKPKARNYRGKVSALATHWWGHHRPIKQTVTFNIRWIFWRNSFTKAFCQWAKTRIRSNGGSGDIATWHVATCIWNSDESEKSKAKQFGKIAPIDSSLGIHS
jgi:hypothetical protein